MRIRIVPSTTVSFLLLAPVTQASAQLSDESPYIKKATAFTEVFRTGQQVTGVLLSFEKEIANAKLTTKTFGCRGREIARAYANNVPEKAARGVDGKYVIVEFAASGDRDAVVRTSVGKAKLEVGLSLDQLQEVAATDGTIYPAAGGRRIATTDVMNLVVDEFKQLAFADPVTGKVLKYNLFVPRNYSRLKSYPLVNFMHDAGGTSQTIHDWTLVQSDSAIVWATPEAQARHECFVLAPQYEHQVVNDYDEYTDDLDMTIRLIQKLTEEYSIDPDRLYTTGQSGGCMMSMAMGIKYENLFAGMLLVAGQWGADKVGPLADDNIWIIVSEGDAKAYPGMNAVTEALEKHGAKVSRAVWDAQSSPAEFATLAREMMTQKANVNYAVFRKGTIPGDETGGGAHMNSFGYAYSVGAVRDWLFMQEK
jgi:predicted peptidase